jgi:Predicted Zn-dependent proteases and their inactivated homologs
MDFEKLVDWVATRAKELKVGAFEIGVTQSSGFTVTVRKGLIESLEHHQGQRISITIYLKNSFGMATASSFDERALNSLIEKACNIAKFTEEDPYLGLADRELLATSYPKLELDFACPINLEQAVAIARSCEASGLNYSRKIIDSEGATVNCGSSVVSYANSNGFLGSIRGTDNYLGCSFIAGEGIEMQRDGYYDFARDYTDLEDHKEIGLEAARRSAARLGARKITSKKCPVLFSAEIASSLIGKFVSAVSGGAQYRKSSFLLDSIWQQVFSKQVLLVEKPFLPKALGSVPYDDEGVRLLPESVLVKDGVLQRYVLDSYAARKLKTVTTGNAGGVHNLTLEPNSLGLDHLIKEMDTGLLVSELMGGNTNPITGDYSCGVFGFWVENGEIKYPVTGVTVAANLKDLFLGITLIGNDVDRRNNILTGSILVDEMTIAGC